MLLNVENNKQRKISKAQLEALKHFAEGAKLFIDKDYTEGNGITFVLKNTFFSIKLKTVQILFRNDLIRMYKKETLTTVYVISEKGKKFIELLGY